jgi:hypothetical protein
MHRLITLQAAKLNTEATTRVYKVNIKHSRVKRKGCRFSRARITPASAQRRISNRKTKDINRGNASTVDPASDISEDDCAKGTAGLYADRSRLLVRWVVWSAEGVTSPEEQVVHADPTTLRNEVA